MAFFIETNKRLIIPRWREYRRKSLSFEHLPKTQDKQQASDTRKEDIFFLATLRDWKQSPSIPTAIELVNAANALNLKEDATEAARFLRNYNNLPAQLFHIIKVVLKEAIEEEKPKTIDTPLDTFYKYIGKKVNYIRKRLINYQTNPLLWLELARLHSILGNNEKAERSLLIGHKLSGGLNRAITRAYSRFYYHIGDTERAHDIIRQSPLIGKDPWIMSAEISYAVKRDRFSPNVKKGIELIDTRQYSPTEISELASMVGTIEMFTGSTRKAKKFVQKSLISPNDNSLAQAEWLSRHIDNIEFSPWLDKVDFAYEAKAFEYLNEKKFTDSLRESCNWVIDQPFSSRAIQLSSYVAAALINNPRMAIDICNFGLRSNPESFEILNNLVYASCLDNDTETAENLITKMVGLIREEKHKIFILANQGLILFRQKMPIEGKKKYQEAFALADKLEEPNLKHIAQINLWREELLAKTISKDSAISFLRGLGKQDTSFQVNAEITRILTEIEKNPTFIL